MSTRLTVAVALTCCAAGAAWAQEPGEDPGQFSANPHLLNSTSNRIVSAGSPYSSTGVSNPTSRYGNPHGNQSATNPFATEAPRLYDSNGNYRGRLSANPYDPDSTSNPYGRYGSKFSPDSINNRYGAGNPYGVDSPSNPYGKGLKIVPGDTATEATQQGQTQTDTPLQHQPQQTSLQSQESADSATTAGESTNSEEAE